MSDRGPSPAHGGATASEESPALSRSADVTAVQYYRTPHDSGAPHQSRLEANAADLPSPPSPEDLGLGDRRRHSTNTTGNSSRMITPTSAIVPQFTAWVRKRHSGGGGGSSGSGTPTTTSPVTTGMAVPQVYTRDGGDKTRHGAGGRPSTSRESSLAAPSAYRSSQHPASSTAAVAQHPQLRHPHHIVPQPHRHRGESGSPRQGSLGPLVSPSTASSSKSTPAQPSLYGSTGLFAAGGRHATLPFGNAAATASAAAAHHSHGTPYSPVYVNVSPTGNTSGWQGTSAAAASESGSPTGGPTRQHHQRRPRGNTVGISASAQAWHWGAGSPASAAGGAAAHFPRRTRQRRTRGGESGRESGSSRSGTRSRGSTEDRRRLRNVPDSIFSGVAPASHGRQSSSSTAVSSPATMNSAAMPPRPTPTSATSHADAQRAFPRHHPASRLDSGSGHSGVAAAGSAQTPVTPDSASANCSFGQASSSAGRGGGTDVPAMRMGGGALRRPSSSGTLTEPSSCGSPPAATPTTEFERSLATVAAAAGAHHTATGAVGVAAAAAIAEPSGTYGESQYPTTATAAHNGSAEDGVSLVGFQSEQTGSLAAEGGAAAVDATRRTASPPDPRTATPGPPPPSSSAPTQPQQQQQQSLHYTLPPSHVGGVGANALGGPRNFAHPSATAASSSVAATAAAALPLSSLPPPPPPPPPAHGDHLAAAPTSGFLRVSSFGSGEESSLYSLNHSTPNSRSDSPHGWEAPMGTMDRAYTSTEAQMALYHQRVDDARMQNALSSLGIGSVPLPPPPPPPPQQQQQQQPLTEAPSNSPPSSCGTHTLAGDAADAAHPPARSSDAEQEAGPSFYPSAGDAFIEGGRAYACGLPGTTTAATAAAAAVADYSTPSRRSSHLVMASATPVAESPRGSIATTTSAEDAYIREEAQQRQQQRIGATPLIGYTSGSGSFAGRSMFRSATAPSAVAAMALEAEMLTSPRAGAAAGLARRPTTVPGSTPTFVSSADASSPSSPPPASTPAVCTPAGVFDASMSRRPTMTGAWQPMNASFSPAMNSSMANLNASSLFYMNASFNAASMRDPLAASVVMQQNRTALVAELKRRRQRLQKQLGQLQREATARNIFALIRASNASQVQYLLQEGLSNVNDRDYNGCTPLHVAAGEGNQAIVRVLLSFGADVLAVDHSGRTPLDCAAANRHGGVGRYLLTVIRNKHLGQEQQQQPAKGLGGEGVPAKPSTAAGGRNSPNPRRTGYQQQQEEGRAQLPARQPPPPPPIRPPTAPRHLSPASLASASTVAGALPSQPTDGGDRSPPAHQRRRGTLAHSDSVSESEAPHSSIVTPSHRPQLSASKLMQSDSPSSLPTLSSQQPPPTSPLMSRSATSDALTGGSAQWRRNSTPHGSSPTCPVVLSALHSSAAARSRVLIAAAASMTGATVSPSSSATSPRPTLSAASTALDLSGGSPSTRAMLPPSAASLRAATAGAALASTSHVPPSAASRGRSSGSRPVSPALSAGQSATSQPTLPLAGKITGWPTAAPDTHTQVMSDVEGSGGTTPHQRDRPIVSAPAYLTGGGETPESEAAAGATATAADYGGGGTGSMPSAVGVSVGGGVGGDASRPRRQPLSLPSASFDAVLQGTPPPISLLRGSSAGSEMNEAAFTESSSEDPPLSDPMTEAELQQVLLGRRGVGTRRETSDADALWGEGEAAGAAGAAHRGTAMSFDSPAALGAPHADDPFDYHDDGGRTMTSILLEQQQQQQQQRWETAGAASATRTAGSAATLGGANSVSSKDVLASAAVLGFSPGTRMLRPLKMVPVDQRERVGGLPTFRDGVATTTSTPLVMPGAKTTTTTMTNMSASRHEARSSAADTPVLSTAASGTGSLRGPGHHLFRGSQRESLSVYDMGQQSLEEHHQHVRLTATTGMNAPRRVEATAAAAAVATGGAAAMAATTLLHAGRASSAEASAPLPTPTRTTSAAGLGTVVAAQVQPAAAVASADAPETTQGTAGSATTTTSSMTATPTSVDVEVGGGEVDCSPGLYTTATPSDHLPALRLSTSPNDADALPEESTVNEPGSTSLAHHAQLLQRSSRHAAEEAHFLEQAQHEPANLAALHHSSYTTVCDTVSIIVCMVGLPGRGKSFISKRLVRYMNWKGVPCRVFNAGDYRRQLLGVEGTAGNAFFDPNNPQGAQLRERMAELACEDLVHFLSSHSLALGILDATNTTRKRRAWLADYFQQEAGKRGVPYRLLFIESVCTDDTIVTENILRSKCDNDDFKNVKDVGAIIAEFRSRILQYEKVYETCEPAERLAYIKIINVKHHVILHHVPNGLGSRIAFFLLNLHPIAFPIYVALPGETVGDKKHAYGGEERLTARGEAYAVALKNFIQDRYVPHMVVLHATNYSVLSTLAPLMDGATEEEAALILQVPAVSSGGNASGAATATAGNASSARHTTNGSGSSGTSAVVSSYHTSKAATPAPAPQAQPQHHREPTPHRTPLPAIFTAAPAVNVTGPPTFATTPCLAPPSSASVSMVVATPTSAEVPPLLPGHHGEAADDPLTPAQPGAPGLLAVPAASASTSLASTSSHSRHFRHRHGTVFPTKHPHPHHHSGGDAGEESTSSTTAASPHTHSNSHQSHSSAASSSRSASRSRHSSLSRHTLPNTEAPVSKLHPYAPTTTLEELRAMAGGDLSVVPLPALRALAALETAAQAESRAAAAQEKEGEDVAAASTSAAEAATHAEDNAMHNGNTEEKDNELDRSSCTGSTSGSDSEELCDEVLCPVPGLDNINYGRFSGHTAAWVKEKYPRLSAMLYDIGEEESTAHATTGAAAARPGTGGGEEGAPHESAKTTESAWSGASNTATSTGNVTLPAPVHYASHAEAVSHLQHAPSGADPRLSYCIQFPNGESCRQVNVRLEPALMAVMRTQSPVFVVAPAVPAQGILAFFVDVIPELSPTLRIPAGCVVEIGVKNAITVHPLLPDSLPESMTRSPVTTLPDLQDAMREAAAAAASSTAKE